MLSLIPAIWSQSRHSLMTVLAASLTFLMAFLLSCAVTVILRSQSLTTGGGGGGRSRLGILMVIVVGQNSKGILDLHLLRLY